jgi:hypothetical protein
MAIISFYEVAAISMALHKYMEEDVHDKESYKITIKRKPWQFIQPQEPSMRIIKK